MSNWKVILATLAIFAAGALAGGALIWKIGLRSESPRELPFDPREMRRGYVKFLDHELHLSDQQRGEISTVLSNSHNRIKLFFEDFNPKMRKEMEQVRIAIKAYLTPEQQTKFDEIRKRRKRHSPRGSRSKDGKGGPPPERFGEEVGSSDKSPSDSLGSNVNVSPTILPATSETVVPNPN